MEQQKKTGKKRIMTKVLILTVKRSCGMVECIYAVMAGQVLYTYVNRKVTINVKH